MERYSPQVSSRQISSLTNFTLISWKKKWRVSFKKEENLSMEVILTGSKPHLRERRGLLAGFIRRSERLLIPERFLSMNDFEESLGGC